MEHTDERVHVYRFAETPWHVPQADGTSGEVVGDVGRDVAGRKYLAQGDSGFYVQVVRIPPNFAAPQHSHDHAEVFMVLDGSCRFNGSPMTQYDMTVVAADQRYGFESGPDGVAFLVVRPGPSGFNAVETTQTHADGQGVAR